MQTQDGDGTTRRRLLKVGLGAVGGAFAIGAARAADNDAVETKPTKLSPEAVQYQPTPKEWKKCLYCTYFQAPNACAIVSGTVSPQGWCNHFALAHE
jgi:hypothetical protein